MMLPVHLVYFEDMKSDFASVAAQVAAFLEAPLSAAALEQVARRCGFEAMRSRHAVPDAVRHRVNAEHFRRGEVGSWREALTTAQAKRVDDETRRQLAEELSEGLRIHDFLPD